MSLTNMYECVMLEWVNLRQEANDANTWSTREPAQFAGSAQA